MDTRWTKHIRDPKEKEKLLGILKASSTMRDLLAELLKKELEELTSKASQEKDFDNASWPYLQAFRNGKIAHIRSQLDLLDFTNKEQHG